MTHTCFIHPWRFFKLWIQVFIPVLAFLVSANKSSAQFINPFALSDSARIVKINESRYYVDKISEPLDSISFSLDSIEVSTTFYRSKIRNVCIFSRSKTRLTINFYFQNCELVLADVREACPRFDELYAYTAFYFKNDSVFHESGYYTILACMAIPLDRSIREIYGYNLNLGYDFFKKFTLELYNRVKVLSPACSQLITRRTSPN